MLVLPNRRCGKVALGGLYAVSRKSVFGTLAPFTAIASPLPAEVRNPRRPEVIDTARTLCGLAGLVHVDPHVTLGRFARLPKIGLADYFGRSQGYRSTWDCIEETQRLGVCRRVAQVPNVPLPCPVLMLHAEAVVDADVDVMREWLFEEGIVVFAQSGRVYDTNLEDQPWREASSLGRKGDDNFMWHPHVGLWRIIPHLRERRLFKRFRTDCGVRFEEGVFGLSWITDFCYTLKDDEVEVPLPLAMKGVVGAYAEDDSRVT